MVKSDTATNEKIKKTINPTIQSLSIINAPHEVSNPKYQYKNCSMSIPR